MRDETNSMHLYHMTLQKPTAITSAVQGNFSAPRVHEIVVARGRVLELLRWEDKSELRSVWSSDVFGLVRSIATFRLTGMLRLFPLIFN
jgi:splicing factor 3B subunit 3